jgi:hypothetical protein
MAHTSKVLYFNQLNNVLGTILAPSGVKYHIQNVKLCNINTVEETVEFDYDDGVVGPFYTDKIKVGAGESVSLDYIGCGDVVEDGHVIQGKSTTAAMVTCKISGFEVS